MEIGIFEKTFVRSTLEEAVDAVDAQGIKQVQFNMSCAGLPSLPDRIDSSTCDRIRNAHEARGITIAAVSGTFNMAHPDPEKRRDGLWRLRTLAAAAPRLGTSVITLSTGTRHPTDLWSHHPESSSPAAWADLLLSLREAVRIAQDTGITLAFEPEITNVVDSARKARRLLDELGSPRLKVVIDGANLFPAGSLGRMREILEEAFELLGREIVLAHAKDLSTDGAAGHEAAGTGCLDYPTYLRLLRAVGYSGPLILHGLREDQVGASTKFLRGLLRETARV